MQPVARFFDLERFAGDLGLDEVAHLLDRWISQAQRCRLAPFVTAAKTIRKHRDGILAAIRLGINNGWASHCTSC